MENWKIIVSFLHPHEAHMAKVYLESEGIETIIQDEMTVQVINIYSNAIGGVKILVKEADYYTGLSVLQKGGYINESKKVENANMETNIVSIVKSIGCLRRRIREKINKLFSKSGAKHIITNK